MSNILPPHSDFIMNTLLASVGCQSLLVAFCIYNSYGSWTELQQSLTIIGCSCLFFCALLQILEFPAKKSHHPPKLSSSPLPRYGAMVPTAKVSSPNVDQTKSASTESASITTPPHVEPESKTTIKSVNEIPMDIDHSVHTHAHTDTHTHTDTVHDCKQHSLPSLNTTLSSMSPLPSLGLSPTLSLSPKSTSIVKPTSGIRSPSASMSPSKFGKKTVKKLNASKQELHPLLHQVQVPGTSKLSISIRNDYRREKRNDYLDWTDYFLSVAMLSAMRSKDPSTQVGACIVNEEKRIVGIGYNGFPKGCSDDELPWSRKSDKGQNDTKYPYVCHAEMNAIMNKNSATCKDCTMYVVLFPCNDCAKLIIQAGIRRVIYICDKYAKTDSVIASKRLFTMAGVKFTQYVPRKESILIKFPTADQ